MGGLQSEVTFRLSKSKYKFMGLHPGRRKGGGGGGREGSERFFCLRFGGYLEGGPYCRDFTVLRVKLKFGFDNVNWPPYRDSKS